MTENADIIIQLLIILSLLLYLNQKRLQRQIDQLKAKATEFMVEESQVLVKEQPLQEEPKVPAKMDFAKRMRSNGKIWQPSIQQQQKALIENMVDEDVGKEESAPKPKKKKATVAKSTKKKSAKKKETDES